MSERPNISKAARETRAAPHQPTRAQRRATRLARSQPRCTQGLAGGRREQQTLKRAAAVVGGRREASARGRCEEEAEKHVAGCARHAVEPPPAIKCCAAALPLRAPAAAAAANPSPARGAAGTPGCARVVAEQRCESTDGPRSASVAPPPRRALRCGGGPTLWRPTVPTATGERVSALPLRPVGRERKSSCGEP